MEEIRLSILVGKRVPSQNFVIFRFCLHNSKWYNTAKHSYKHDAIGSMIGMATINDFLNK